jgi:1,4-dihydroxy-2-naphthoate polyprenyltransferase
MNEAQVTTRRDMWVHMLLYPGHTLPTAAAPALVAVGLAVRNEVFAAVPVLLAFFAGWLIQLGGVLTDNYENLVKHPNDREHPQLVHALRDGALTLSGLRTAIFGCYGAALLAGAWLLHHAGVPVLVIGLSSIAASWIYSGGPFPFGERGIADPLFFVFFGIVSVVGCYYVQAVPAYDLQNFRQALPDAFPFSAFALSLPIGALTTNILIIDDIRDREFDVVKGKRTVAVRAGMAWSRAEFVALLVLSYLAPFWFWLGLGFGASILLPLLTLPYALSTVRGTLTLDRFEDLVPMTPKAARLLLSYAVLLAIGVAKG